MTGAAQGVSQVQREGEVLSLMGKRREAPKEGGAPAGQVPSCHRKGQ